MRFINTRTLKLQEIADHNVDALQNGYAILSHRWRDEEITYEDMLNPQPPRHKLGWKKLEDFCTQVLRENFDLAWMDTCCINKSSSAELSEAITSMYRWYIDARKCYAYLDDVTADPEMKSFSTSEWFERGWTLQELLAPRILSFYDRSWQHIGSKSTHTFLLETITNIPVEALDRSRSLQSYSIVQRMCWASRRKVTRIEDRAYSLLGLFGVTSLQTNYGEREKAFIRLQEEIIKYSADESIFAWQLDPSREYSGLLASSPADFSDCSHLYAIEKRPYAFDNMGLSLNLATKPYNLNVWLAHFNVTDVHGYFQGILISQLPEQGQYARVKNSHGQSRLCLPHRFKDHSTLRRVRMRQEARESPVAYFPGFYLERIEPPAFQDYEVRIVSRVPCIRPGYIRLPEDTPGTVGTVELVPRQQNSSSDWRQLRWLIFGFDEASDPVCLIANWKSMDVREILKHADAHFRIPLGTKNSAKATERQGLSDFDHQWMSLEGRMPKFTTRWPIGFYVLSGLNKQSPGSEPKNYIKLDSIGLGIYIGLEFSIPCPEDLDKPVSVWTVRIFPLGGTHEALSSLPSESASKPRSDRTRTFFSRRPLQDTVQNSLIRSP